METLAEDVERRRGLELNESLSSSSVAASPIRLLKFLPQNTTLIAAPTLEMQETPNDPS